MHTITPRTPVVNLTTQTATAIDTDLLVVPTFLDDDLADLPDLDRAANGEIARARARGAFTGKPFETLEVALSSPSATRLALIGAGSRTECSTTQLRRIAVAGGLLARLRRLARVALVHRPDTGVDASGAAQVMAEGVTLANFEGASYRTGADPTFWIQQVDILVDETSAATTTAVEKGRVLGECTNMARSLANEPGNSLTPTVFADQAVQLAQGTGLVVEVLDERRIAELKMGLLLGVAQGSQEPPRLIVLRHDPPGAADAPVLGLVGKGVTFDTGGISIKPADHMDRMKDDMSGGATVLSAMVGIARLGVPLRCIGVIPAAENMPGGRAIKPGDILTSAEGKTVEVINTDAEGRLILGDALWYARQLGATHLVDVATLTGSCVVALGKTTSGLFGTPDAWVDRVLQASGRAGDRSWPMPTFDDYKEQLKSEIADITNTGSRAGGAITAALFIKEFAGDLPWLHMDIAGTAWSEEATPYQPKGATGVGVRTLVELAIAAPDWSRL